MNTAIMAFEETWITHFWYPKQVRGDKAFNEGEFKIYMDNKDIKFDLIPPGRHRRSAIESKHALIRNIFIRLQKEGSLNNQTSAAKAVAISTDLYGSSIMSSFDLPKGYSKPVDGTVTHVTEDIVKAYEAL